MPIASSGYKGVSRIDHPAKNMFGWYVRVPFQGRIYSKFFNDNKHGGKEKALKKAVQYRNKIEREIGKPRTDRPVVTSNPKNRTGVLGVQRVVSIRKNKKAPPKEYVAYVVTWQPESGVLKREIIPVEPLGEEKAFQKAVKIRRQKEKEMFGKPLDFNTSKAPDKETT